jgi:hypothetical protein
MSNARRGLPLIRAHVEQIFPKLTTTQVRRMAAHGHMRAMKRGEVLYDQGESASTFFVVVSHKRRGYAGSSHDLSERQGYAGSSHDLSVSVSIQQQAADCKELMKTLDIKRAHIVAHSYAGLRSKD